MKVYAYIKQVLDIFFAVCLTIFLLPLLIILSVLIKLDSKGPVLFLQKRIGKDRREFYIYKFRSMRTEAPSNMPTHLFQDAESYITKSGHFLRKSSLDEVPQLLNILKGDMSFIGPRPALWNQEDLIKARDEQAVKTGVSANSVKPGITGWAQINGRDELSVDLKADLDGYYVKNIRLSLDLKILVLTVIKVLTRHGISEGGPKAN